MRHGEKAWENGKKPINMSGYSHDPPLVNSFTVVQSVEKLKKYRIDAIYCSPFLRCRQTAEIVCRHLGLKYQVDSRLREYLGNWKIHELDLDPATIRGLGNIDIVETFKEFNNRYRDLLKSELFRPGNLLITHNMIIRFTREEIMKKNNSLSLGAAEFVPFRIQRNGMTFSDLETTTDLTNSKFLVLNGPMFDGNEKDIHPELYRIIDEKKLKNYRVFPLDDPGSIFKILHENLYKDSTDVFYKVVENSYHQLPEFTANFVSVVSRL